MGEPPLTYLPREEGFLEPDRPEPDGPGAPRAVVIPFPLEASVTWGAGTARGPEALLAASHALELFDDELAREPCRDFSIATLAPPAVATPLAAAIDQIAGIVGAILGQGAFPLVLGGEHALTAGAVRPFVQGEGEGGPLTVLHLDAHADLRDGYLGEPFSHAAAMRRVLDHPGVEIVSLGLRSLSAEEWDDLNGAVGERVQVYWARERAGWDLDALAARLEGRRIYVSLDVDVLDPAAMPATGTPEPGGLSFEEVCRLLRLAARAGTIVGADIVELAPMAGFHAADFTAAKLAYKLLAYALSDAPRGTA